ncbi:hypothetical protein SODALDRAFT_114428 [Sodiomyces alkalinus F11]|uniref:Uncharacterized protein n=1 Tax=Sodiomyces alkalinus (strain CBS 110278 / VKM F-3762 / F11) TaxID=1314773 RepID=A0A3N2Q366_SODAK|nr:hypothetical protein SODALDRAFT_114428 [Sodiomyces alkalinus F11]ROT41211.1 hypothetical protein SODALDRAFT_114428 [Sodiomyces alkalinus F11]
MLLTNHPDVRGRNEGELLDSHPDQHLHSIHPSNPIAGGIPQLLFHVLATSEYELSSFYPYMLLFGIYYCVIIGSTYQSSLSRPSYFLQHRIAFTSVTLPACPLVFWDIQISLSWYSFERHQAHKSQNNNHPSNA